MSTLKKSNKKVQKENIESLVRNHIITQLIMYTTGARVKPIQSSIVNRTNKKWAKNFNSLVNKKLISFSFMGNIFSLFFLKKNFHTVRKGLKKAFETPRISKRISQYE